ncbi:unnamed protein product [Prunus armeniaca]
MAFFKCFKKGTITILEDESDNRDEGTTLHVGAPLLASEVSEVDNFLHIPSWSQEVFCQLSSFKKSKSTDRDLHSTILQLKSSHQTDTGSSKAFELLSDQIHNGAVNWSSALPMAVIPTTESLNRKDHKGVSYIPHICRYLFLAYHNILRDSKGKSGVRITAWIKYGYRGPFKYKKPLRKTIRNKSQKPKEDSDPSGIIPMSLKRTEEEEGVFEDLGITDEDMEKSYLAAFFACRLCKFVFPKDDVTLIRPGVFKVASRMAHGVSFGLAVPVLASIYKGLQDISSADDPGNCATILPFHYVYRWLGEYFDTHFTSSSEKSIPIMARFSRRLSAKFFEDSTAQALFRTCGKVEMSHLARVFSKCKQLTDEDHISKEDFEYFMCLHSRFVSLRQENYRVIQPYSPYRFSRQFCYVQHVPGELKDDVRNGTVLSVYSHWKSCLKIRSISTITLPTNDNIREFEVTSDEIKDSFNCRQVVIAFSAKIFLSLKATKL